MWLRSWWKIHCGYRECAHYLHSRFLILAQHLSSYPNQLFVWAFDWCKISGLMSHYLLPRILVVLFSMPSHARRNRNTEACVSYFYIFVAMSPWAQCVALRRQMKWARRSYFVPSCTHQDLKLQAIKLEKAWWELVSDPLHQRDFVLIVFVTGCWTCIWFCIWRLCSDPAVNLKSAWRQKAIVSRFFLAEPENNIV